MIYVICAIIALFIVVLVIMTVKDVKHQRASIHNSGGKKDISSNFYSKDKQQVSDEFANQLEAFVSVFSIVMVGLLGFAVLACIISLFMTSAEYIWAPICGILVGVILIFFFLSIRWAVVLYIRMYEMQAASLRKLDSISASLEKIVDNAEVKTTDVGEYKDN